MEIALKPLEISDFDQLAKWIPSKRFHVQWCGTIFRFPLGETQLQKYLGKCGETPPRRLGFKAVDADNNMVGQISFHIVNVEHGYAHLGPILVGDPALRGKGIGSEMIYKMQEIAFEELKLHRIDLYVFDFNTSAIACYEKVGFAKEGLLRDTTRVEDEYWSPYLMSILAAEWRARGK